MMSGTAKRIRLTGTITEDDISLSWQAFVTIDWLQEYSSHDSPGEWSWEIVSLKEIEMEFTSRVMPRYPLNRLIYLHDLGSAESVLDLWGTDLLEKAIEDLT